MTVCTNHVALCHLVEHAGPVGDAEALGEWTPVECPYHGEWRSLVAHPAGGRAVAGSNPVSPTIKSLQIGMFERRTDQRKRSEGDKGATNASGSCKTNRRTPHPSRRKTPRRRVGSSGRNAAVAGAEWTGSGRPLIAERSDAVRRPRRTGACPDLIGSRVACSALRKRIGRRHVQAIRHPQGCGAPSFWPSRFCSVACSRCRGSRAAVSELGDSSASSCSGLQLERRAASTTSTRICSHHSRTCASNDGVGAEDCGVASAPVGRQVVDRSEVRVDRELVAAWVVAGCLVLEVARRSGPVAGGDPGDVGKIDGIVGAGIVISAVCGRPDRPTRRGRALRWRERAPSSWPAVRCALGAGSLAGPRAHRRRWWRLTWRMVAVAAELAGSG